MKIRGLIWFDEIIDKLDRKHNVSQNEVRERACHYYISKRYDACREEKM